MFETLQKFEDVVVVTEWKIDNFVYDLEDFVNKMKAAYTDVNINILSDKVIYTVTRDERCYYYVWEVRMDSLILTPMLQYDKILQAFVPPDKLKYNGDRFIYYKNEFTIKYYDLQGVELPDTYIAKAKMLGLLK